MDERVVMSVLLFQKPKSFRSAATRVASKSVAVLFAAVTAAGVTVSVPAYSGEADVIDVKARQVSPDMFHFDVTVRHADTGWQHYADRWDIVAPNGDILGTRTLYHPHVEEQPFTRSLGNVEVPATISTVTVQAHDSEHGLGGAVVTVELPREN